VEGQLALPGVRRFERYPIFADTKESTGTAPVASKRYSVRLGPSSAAVLRREWDHPVAVDGTAAVDVLERAIVVGDAADERWGRTC
jgi:hypothetical protein